MEIHKCILTKNNSNYNHKKVTFNFFHLSCVGSTIKDFQVGGGGA